jgi:hypothetical protein
MGSGKVRTIFHVRGGLAKRMLGQCEKNVLKKEHKKQDKK